MHGLQKVNSNSGNSEMSIGKVKKVILYVIFIILCMTVLLMSVINIYYTDIDKAKTLSEAQGINIGYEKGKEDGYKNGYNTAVIELITTTEDCKVSSIFINNITVNVARIECMVKK